MKKSILLLVILVVLLGLVAAKRGGKPTKPNRQNANRRGGEEETEVDEENTSCTGKRCGKPPAPRGCRRGRNCDGDGTTTNTDGTPATPEETPSTSTNTTETPPRRGGNGRGGKPAKKGDKGGSKGGKGQAAGNRGQGNRGQGNKGQGGKGQGGKGRGDGGRRPGNPGKPERPNKPSRPNPSRPNPSRPNPSRPNQGRPNPSCKYNRTMVTECDVTTNTQNKTLVLKSGDPTECEETMTVTVKCDKHKMRKENRHCNYTQGTWTECNTTTNRRYRVDTLTDPTETSDRCRPERTIEARCGQQGCEFNWVEGDCNTETNVRTLTGTLMNVEGAPSYCQSTMTKTMKCSKKNGQDKCRFGDWSEYSECIDGRKSRTREVLKGGRRCGKLATETVDCQ